MPKNYTGACEKRNRVECSKMTLFCIATPLDREVFISIYLDAIQLSLLLLVRKTLVALFQRFHEASKSCADAYSPLLNV
jgi:hypothetical protein